jgi:histidinol-phosphate phosphatase family protein
MIVKENFKCQIPLFVCIKAKKNDKCRLAGWFETQNFCNCYKIINLGLEMKDVEQVAILCGGLGSRLRPITDTLPKPMVPVNGKPFLEYLLEQIKGQGISKILLMTGYLGEQIQGYFGDGKKYDLKIQYSHGPIEWDTGRRLIEAKSLLQDRFMIMYSDNFVQVNFKKLAAIHEQTGKLLSLVVQSKKNGNIRLGEDDTVEVYDKKRSVGNLNFVELGFMSTNKGIFDYYQEADVSLSDILFRLVKDRQISGMIVKDTYYSVSDPKRLKLTCEYLKPKKIILIDRDGVINEKAPKGEYITKWSDFSFISETVEGLRHLSEDGFQFIVISNQAGIGRGVVSADSVQKINEKMIAVLKRKGIQILQVYLCPHHWEDECECRKPKPGMFFQAAKEWLLRLDNTFFIGDDYRDCQAAYNAGCKCIFLGIKSNLISLPLDEQPQFIFNKLDRITPSIFKI